MKAIPYCFLCFFFINSCAAPKQQAAVNETTPAKTMDSLPAPYATKSVMHFSNVVGWEEGEAPVAPEGFAVTRYANGLQNPRWMYVLPNGDVLVAESNTEHGLIEKAGAAIICANKSNDMRKSANRITILRDMDKDGKPDVKETFLSGLNQPFGMLLLKNNFYVANTDALWMFPYKKGALTITGEGKKITDLPAGKINRHWTRNIISNSKGNKIYIAIGSGTNVAEKGLDEEKDKAQIWEINPDGSGLKVYASGLRNPVGMDWAPGTQTLWVAVNERDELGDDLVPDYITGVKRGGFYGWPYAYFGQHIDPRIEAKDQQPELVKKAIVPDVALGAHTASLGLLFYTGKQFPPKYRNGAFVAQHGSWNRSVLAGYKVMFIPFKNGKPAGEEEDFLTGFIIEPDGKKVHGRPVGLAMLSDGSMLVTDDTSDIIWRVSAE
ncbi:sorbosone dehydrogenase family protein [Agriterribacter sp.]|uniref:PQQ-dependent sugar dehydrogenase n=1 Tax=Agriterribacter sp. TaxID=2821509 RepID=UPI002D1B3BD1|nr:sorbosone dehydrogenase family protein [Agriterribacter sp.]HRP56307.1 sorbosone dehydrogenase family protein [Agriterribacter sp.]